MEGGFILGMPFVCRSVRHSVSNIFLSTPYLLNSERFSLHFTQMFLSVRQCAEHITQLLRLKVTVMGFTLEFCFRSISPESFEGLSFKFTQMFVSVRRCAEPMTRLPRLKVTLQGHVIYTLIHFHSISPEPFEQFSLNFTQMRRCLEHMTQLPRHKVTGIYPGNVSAPYLLNLVSDFH